MTRSKRMLIIILLMLFAVLLAGCVDVFTVPSVAVNNEGQWVAFLASEEFASRFSLRLANVTTGEIINVGEDGSQQGAFAWHPTRPEIAYFNLSVDGVPGIQVSTLENPSIGVNQLGALAFPTSFWITQMAFAPDGNQLAMTALLLPDGSLIDPNQPFDVHLTSGVLYLADLTTGDVQVVSLPQVFPTTLQWSPDGSKIAYTAWADDNQDDVIDPTFDPALGIAPARDRFRIFVFDVASQETSPISAPGAHASPTWLDENNRLAFVSYPLDVSPDMAISSIVSFDLNAQSTTTLVAANGTNQFLGVAAFPDQSRIAYTVVTGTVDFSSAALPSQVLVANVDGSNPVEVFSASGERGVTDVPAWSPDGQTLFVSFGNPPSAQLTAFAEFDDTGATPAAQIIAINVNNPQDTRVIYEGTLANSALMQYNLGSQ